MQQDRSCPFCELETKSESGNLPWNTVLSENSLCRIIPTKGALVPGWILVVTKQHKLCSTAFDEKQFKKITQALDLASSWITTKFGPATIFEHGPSRECSKIGCGIDHAHVHVAYLSFSLAEATSKLFPTISWTEINNFYDLHRVHSLGLDYLYICEPDGRHFFCNPAEKTSQIFRRVIANQIGSPNDWDYHTNDGICNVLETLSIFSKKSAETSQANGIH